MPESEERINRNRDIHMFVLTGRQFIKGHDEEKSPGWRPKDRSRGLGMQGKAGGRRPGGRWLLADGARRFLEGEGSGLG